MSLLRLAPASAVLCAAALAMPVPAGAVIVGRSFAQTGTGACQPALPVYAGVIRARPLAIQNEATTSAYLNCSLQGTHLGPAGSGRAVKQIFVGLINNTTADVDVTCSTIDGLAKITPAFISSKTTTVLAGSWKELTWVAADNNGVNFLFNANMQCLLPPGIGVSYLVSIYDEDIGA